MFQKLRYKFSMFMQGRYGLDNLTRFLLILWIVIWLILRIFSSVAIVYNILSIANLALFIYTYYRVFSKNISKRYDENQKYLAIKSKVVRFFNVKKSRMAKRKTHHLYKCPQCKQILSVPKGKGKINITCPKCNCKFTKRS